MTIRKGEAWGSPVDPPDQLRECGSDAEIAEAFGEDPRQVVGLGGGDLFRSLGSPGRRAEMQLLPIDLMDVTLDGRPLVASAHVVVRRSWWRGPILAVMNVDHLGDWNVAPRAHPNDGRFDVVDVSSSMSVRHRLQARGRLTAGTHVPHPDISVRTAEHFQRTFARPQHVWVDGVRRPDALDVTVTIRPDAFAVVI